MKRLLIICISMVYLFTFQSVMYSRIFKLNYSDIDKYELTIKGNFKIYLNGKYEGLQTNEMKGILKIIHLDSNRIMASGDVYQYNKSIRDYSTIGVKIDKFEKAKFIFKPDGIIISSSNPIFPPLQNIPFFPDKDIKSGDIYQGYGRAGVILYNTGDIEEIEVSITVLYAGTKKYMGNEYDYFRISYNYEDVISQDNIKKANGRHDLELYFDNDEGKPVFMSDKFLEEFRLKNNDTIRRDGFFLYFYKKIKPMDKRLVLNDLTSDIDKKTLEDLDFKEKEEGISITINNLKFRPNSIELLDTEKPKLEDLYKMLSRIKDRNFMIIGHTALFGTEKDQMDLSVERAKTIAEYLIKRGISPDRIFYSGKGAKEPVAPNDTEENMKKNRRVEIIILED